jgi:hypothetical protein
MSSSAIDVIAVTCEGDAINCEKVADAASAIPDDLAGLDEPALEALVVRITHRLHLAKRVMQEKLDAKVPEPDVIVPEPDVIVKPLSHIDSFAINKERLSNGKPIEAEPPLKKHVEPTVFAPARLAEEAPSSNREGPTLPALIAVGVAVAVFLLARRRK